MAKQIPLKQVPAHRSVDDILADIKTLYFQTTSATIERDFERAIDLLKAMPLPEDRQRATVYMEGLAEMRRDWQKQARKRRRRAT